MTAESPKVSVIVPTLNRRMDLLEFADSLLAQTVRPFEFLVVDAGSVPDMEQALRDRLSGSGINLVYRRSAAGTSLQRNVALDLMQGEFVLLCDDDLLLEPDYLEKKPGSNAAFLRAARRLCVGYFLQPRATTGLAPSLVSHLSHDAGGRR